MSAYLKLEKLKYDITLVAQTTCWSRSVEKNNVQYSMPSQCHHSPRSVTDLSAYASIHSTGRRIRYLACPSIVSDRCVRSILRSGPEFPTPSSLLCNAGSSWKFSHDDITLLLNVTVRFNIGRIQSVNLRGSHRNSREIVFHTSKTVFCPFRLFGGNTQKRGPFY